ncbi:unannotated protein [freshwater metagenome]|uniref:Unannotated protein n=1 Tax=freshwater metagenome TaxID=449393 RepID=A0A6J6NAH8_9ZZZZ
MPTAIGTPKNIAIIPVTIVPNNIAPMPYLASWPISGIASSHSKPVKKAKPAFRIASKPL